MKYLNDPAVCEKLALAIIQRAAKDYLICLHHIQKDPGNDQWKAELDKLDTFFHSADYARLTPYDPDLLIGQLIQYARKMR